MNRAIGRLAAAAVQDIPWTLPRASQGWLWRFAENWQELLSALLIRSGRGKELLFELDLEGFFRAFGEYIDLKA